MEAHALHPKESLHLSQIKKNIKLTNVNKSEWMATTLFYPWDYTLPLERTLNYQLPSEHSAQLLGTARWSSTSSAAGPLLRSCCQLLHASDASREGQCWWKSSWQMGASTTLLLWLTARYFRQINLSKKIFMAVFMPRWNMNLTVWVPALQLVEMFQ